MAVKSSFKNMVLCLFVICLVCSGLLAGVYALTAEPIRKAAEAKTNNAIAVVVPEFTGAPVMGTVNAGGKIIHIILSPTKVLCPVMRSRHLLSVSEVLLN